MTGASSSAGARKSVTYTETLSVAPSSSGPRALPSHLLVGKDVEPGLEEAGVLRYVKTRYLTDLLRTFIAPGCSSSYACVFPMLGYPLLFGL
jgi:hypothetical protein